ncbi:MAG: hypothetical protein HC927_10305 [Deltaproteobacteria bacterium]|nr:hypothetical protein [Deltaproteobacteria bacterium]
MSTPGSIHQTMLELLIRDERLAIELAAAAARLDWLDYTDIRLALPNLELPKIFDPPDAAEGKVRLQRLFPDLVFTIHDGEGKLVGVVIFENQIAGDPDKTYKLSGYRALTQMHFEHMTEVIGVSPTRRGRQWLAQLREKVKDPPAVLELRTLTRVCNPGALWLADRQLPTPFAGEEQLQREIALARARPYAALFHAIHYARDPRAWQIVLAALLAAHELGPDQWERYSTMIAAGVSKTMNQRIVPELLKRLPDMKISDWEKKGVAYQSGLDDGRKQGRAQGLAQGLAQGRLQGLRTALLDIFETRGIELDPTIAARIDTCSDPAQLDAWRALAKRGASLAEMFG